MPSVLTQSDVPTKSLLWICQLLVLWRPQGMAGSKPLQLLYHQLSREGLKGITYVFHRKGVGCIA